MKLLTRALAATTVIAAIAASAATPDRVQLDTGWTVTGLGPKPVEVTLPHDWSIHHNFDSLAPAGNDGAYLPTGERYITYTRTLDLDTIEPGTYYLYLEGAYMDSEVWVNDTIAGYHTYGFTSYRVDITPYLHTGENSIEVCIDNSEQKNCRWYTGTGLYRPVWLEHYGPISLPNGITYTTLGVRPGMAIGRIMSQLHSTGLTAPVTVSAILSITAPDGTPLPPATKMITLDPQKSYSWIDFEFPIPDPALWSPATPEIYTATLEIAAGDRILATDVTEFGIRTIDYNAEEGFLLNDEPLLINGACVHHDNGLLGAAAYSAAEWRKAALLKQAGFNAVRTAHNPPSPAFLRACDHLGLLVIDEAFDGWEEPKNENDYSTVFYQDHSTDLRMMLERDINHPSIIAWSIGNEIIERKSPEAVELAAEMADLCRTLSPDRAVTQALAAWDSDWEIYDPLAAEHDIVGYNYMIHKAESDHERVPERVMWQTESYPRDAFKNYVMVRDHPYVIGDFVWTGIDYLGESGIGRHYYEGQVPGEHYERDLWPWHAAVCGDIDLIGQRKPISYYREMLWTGKPTLYMAVREPDGYRGTIRETLWGTWPTEESWTWPGHEGKPIEVEVITTMPVVELYLDDTLVEKKSVSEATEYKAVFTLPYAPGTLRATAYGPDGKPAETTELRTAGDPAAIHLEAERYSTDDVDYDLVYVTASIVDADGVVNPLATNVLSFSVTPNGEILATGTADPTDLIGYTVKNRVAYRGRAQAIVKTPRNVSPTLTVSNALLPTATLLLTTK